MASPTTRKPPAKGGFKRSQLTLWLSVAFVGIVLMSLPTVLIIIFGLLPSFVAYVIDRSKGKHAAFCVGGINFCGVFPYMLQLWTGENTLNESVRIMTDVFSLAIMYGAAAFGWMIYQSLPPIITTFMTVIAQHRVSTLRAQQRTLVEEWGNDVSTPQEILNLGNDMELSENTDTEDGDAGNDMDNTEAVEKPPTAPSSGQSRDANAGTTPAASEAS